MKKTYENYLLENEKVLWEGKAENFKLLDRDYKMPLLMSWSICILVVIAYLVLYVPYSIENGLMGSNVIVISTVVGACIACVMARPLMDRNGLLKKTTYVLTNHRALVVNGMTVKAVFIDANTPCQLVKLENGADAVMIGTAVGSLMKKSRTNAIHGIPAEDNRAKLAGMVFYSVKNAKKVCDSYAPFKTA